MARDAKRTSSPCPRPLPRLRPRPRPEDALQSRDARPKSDAEESAYIWPCVVCGRMTNGSQYCRKTYCPEEGLDMTDEDEGIESDNSVS